MATLKKFRTSANLSVQAQLRSAWDRFDTDDYVREVLRHTTGDAHVEITSPEQAALLPLLKDIRWLRFSGDLPAARITAAIKDEAQLTSLSISDNTTLENLGFLSRSSNLTSLILGLCPNLADLSVLAGTPLERFGVFESTPAPVRVLELLPELRHLYLAVGLPYRDLGELPVVGDLQTLQLGPETCRHLELHGITRLPGLTSLNLCGPAKGLAEASALPALETLVLQAGAHTSMLRGLPTIPRVTELFLGISARDDLMSLDPGTFPRLTSLQLACHDNPVDLSPLQDFRDLTVTVRDASEVSGAEHLAATITRIPRPRT
jgi:hypothetical protein